MNESTLRISSKTTFFYKRIFPLLWFGILAAAFIGTGFSALFSSAAHQPSMPMLVIPVGIGLFGFFVMKKYVFDLVDEVYDCGDSLLILNDNREVRISLPGIKNVSYSQLQNPPRVTLSLRRQTVFGTEIAFSPRMQLWPFAKDPKILELIDRIDRSRPVGRT
jgi:ABC-type uncharacterized transport system permease subunit